MQDKSWPGNNGNFFLLLFKKSRMHRKTTDTLYRKVSKTVTIINQLGAD